MKTTIDLSAVIPNIQSALLVKLLASLRQLAAVPCTLPKFTPQHAKQWFAEAKAILSGTFIFDPTLRFFKFVRA